MPGPTPKNPAVRRRTNKTTTAAKLPAKARKTKTPALPLRADEDWHPQTTAWWADIWASPMAPEFLKSDIHGLFVLAVLVDGFWKNPTKELAAEIRLQRQCFGLTPIDRRRLQWEIERVESGSRKSGTKASPPPKTTNDPRRHLTAV